MKTFQSSVLAICVSLVALLPVKADLLPQDNARFGVTSLTLDTRTGLAWLDLPLTAGLSYQQVITSTQPGGAFDGFRYATSQEVLDLYASAGIPSPGDYPESSPVTQSILSLISLVGATSSQDGRPETFGISGTPNFGGRDKPGFDFFLSAGIPEYEVTAGGQFGNQVGETFGSPLTGSWLVQIPEPSSVLLGTGGALILLLGFVKRARR
jgi:hypothetical protein